MRCRYTKELIYKAKGVLATNNGADEPERLASSFQFVAPVVGPLPKDRFLEAFAVRRRRRRRLHTSG